MPFLDDLPALIERAESDAAKGCGQSDVLYDARVQGSYAAILAKAPEEDRAATEDALKKRGFDPEFTPYEAQEGECDMTGIPTDCCPCGHHE